MLLTPEQEELVLKNQKLIRWCLSNIGLQQNSSHYEDNYHVGMIGLIKAAKTFDTGLKQKFSSYAVVCIRNEIFMAYRREAKHNVVLSLDTPVAGKDDEITLEMTLEDPNSDFVEKLVNTELISQSIAAVLNISDTRKKYAYFCFLGRKKQEEIAQMLGISRSYVSRLVQRTSDTIKEVLDKKIKSEEVFVVSIEKGMYKISFSCENIRDFNEVFSTFLMSLACGNLDNLSIAGSEARTALPDFKLSCTKDRILLLLPRCSESFLFLAEIVKKIDNFKISYNASEIEGGFLSKLVRPSLESQKYVAEEAEEVAPEAEEEPVPEEVAEVVSEAEEEPVPEEVAEVAPEVKEEPASEEVTEVVSEAEEEPVPEEIAEVAPEVKEEPVPEEVAEVVSKAEEEPVYEEVTEAAPEAKEEPASEEVAETAPEVKEEPASEEVAEAAPEVKEEPVSEEVAEAAPEAKEEPVPEEKNVQTSSDLTNEILSKVFSSMRIKSNSKMAVVMKYILSREDTFTAQEIMKHFNGEVSAPTVNNAIAYLYKWVKHVDGTRPKRYMVVKNN